MFLAQHLPADGQCLAEDLLRLGVFALGLEVERQIVVTGRCAGVFLALAPLAVLIALGVWGATLWLSGYVSVASLLAAISFPLWVRVTTPGHPYTLWAAFVLALLLVYAHRGNVRRLIDGTENRFRTRKGLTT